MGKLRSTVRFFIYATRLNNSNTRTLYCYERVHTSTVPPILLTVLEYTYLTVDPRERACSSAT